MRPQSVIKSALLKLNNSVPQNSENEIIKFEFVLGGHEMDFIIRNERSQSPLASTWTEYLCLVRVGDGCFPRHLNAHQYPQCS